MPVASEPLVLVVEDDPDTLEFAASLLLSSGFNVVTAHDGDVASECLAANLEIAGIFTDLQMPSARSGYDLIIEARSNGSTIPAILTSGTSNPPRALPAHTTFMPKPYRPQDLIAQLRSVLRASEKETSAPQQC